MVTKTKIDESTSILEFGKIPPQAVDLEEAVLGAIINPYEADIYWRVCDILKPEVFYKEENRIIYSTIEQLHYNSKTVDLLTITEQLRKENNLDAVGGSYYITNLINNVANTANILEYSQIIVEKYILREMIRLSSEFVARSYDESEDCFELLNESITKINSITDFLTNNNAQSSKQIVREIYELMNKPQSEKILSKYGGINNIIGCYEPGNVYIYAGEPGHGKSLIATNEAEFISRKYPVLYFSLEMTAPKLVLRIAADKSEIPNNRLKSGEIHSSEHDKFNKAMGEIEKLNLFINDKPSLNMMQIYLIAKKMKYQYGIKAVILDHFHLVKTKGKDRNAEYSENSAMLKVIAKDLQMPMIALFQMNRERSKRAGSKKPKMSDLREVGEQDADVVNFITRPELLEVTEAADGTSLINRILINNAKNRDGCVGTELIFDFNGDYQRLSEVTNTNPFYDHNEF